MVGDASCDVRFCWHGFLGHVGEETSSQAIAYAREEAFFLSSDCEPLSTPVFLRRGLHSPPQIHLVKVSINEIAT
jgi:hypothetical protein